jgi:hypothetical protein
MPSLSTIALSIKGEARKANLTLNKDSSLSIESLQKYFKKKDEPENICCYDYDCAVGDEDGDKDGVDDNNCLIKLHV